MRRKLPRFAKRLAPGKDPALRAEPQPFERLSNTRFVLDPGSCRRIVWEIMPETAEITQVLHAIGRSEEGAAEKLDEALARLKLEGSRTGTHRRAEIPRRLEQCGNR